MSQTNHIKVTHYEGDACGVTFNTNSLRDDNVVTDAYHEIKTKCFENDKPPKLLVLDFNNIELISSVLLGKLILLQRDLDSDNGKLILTNIRPLSRSIFKTSKMDRLFEIVEGTGNLVDDIIARETGAPALKIERSSPNGGCGYVGRIEGERRSPGRGFLEV